jgi:hypothetical protein
MYSTPFAGLYSAAVDRSGTGLDSSLDAVDVAVVEHQVLLFQHLRRQEYEPGRMVKRIMAGR